jgi:hypothetical protein
MNLIFVLHAFIVILGLLIPFSRNKKWLQMYAIVIPFLFYHWAINDDTCFMTQLECVVTGEPKERTFMGRLVGPIYSVSDDTIGKFLKSILFALWLFVQFRLGNIF